jgi:hypothetical protein
MMRTSGKGGQFGLDCLAPLRAAGLAVDLVRSTEQPAAEAKSSSQRMTRAPARPAASAAAGRRAAADHQHVAEGEAFS